MKTFAEYLKNKTLKEYPKCLEHLTRKDIAELAQKWYDQQVKLFAIPDVSQRSELLSDFEKWLNKKGNESYCNLPAGYVVDKYKSLNCG